MLAIARSKFAKEMSNETMKNPQAMNTFICCVAETLNIADLETIEKMFYQTLPIANKIGENNQQN